MNPFNMNLYGNFRTRTFNEIWENVDSFISDYKNSGITPTLDADNTENKYITTLYYLLYSRYGNSHIASSDETQFKYKVMSTIFMYGPTWEKRLKLQDEIRALTLDEIKEGALSIYNHAFNPSSAPSTQTKEELNYINDQNTTRYKKSNTDSYMIWDSLLKTDVTAYFLDRFKKLFLTIVYPELPLWYISNEEGDENDG